MLSRYLHAFAISPALSTHFVYYFSAFYEVIGKFEMSNTNEPTKEVTIARENESRQAV
jgi:hypothetical protein